MNQLSMWTITPVNYEIILLLNIKIAVKQCTTYNTINTALNNCHVPMIDEMQLLAGFYGQSSDVIFLIFRILKAFNEYKTPKNSYTWNNCYV